MLNAGIVNITTANVVSLVDSVERGEARAGKIERESLVRGDKQNTVGYSRAVAKSSYRPAAIIEPEKNRAS